MIEADRFGSLVEPETQVGEDHLERALRPKLLKEYIGQPVVQEQMEIYIAAAKGRSPNCMSGSSYLSGVKPKCSTAKPYL